MMEYARNENAKRYMVPIRVRDKKGKIDTHYTDYILEVSKNRMFIRTSKPLANGAVIDIEFNLKDSRPILLKGKVIRVSKGSEMGSKVLGAGMGIVFEPIGEDEARRLKEGLHSSEFAENTKEFEHFANWVKTLKKPLSEEERDRVRREWLASVFDGEKGKDASSGGVEEAPESKPAKALKTPKTKTPIIPPEVSREIEPLKKIQLFEELSEPQLVELAEICHKEVFKAGEVIFEEGAIGDKFYMIHKGEIRISKIIQGIGEEALVVLKEGAYFGEMALIDEAPRSATAICNSNATLLVIDKDNFEKLLKENSDLASKLLWTFVRTLSVRLRETNEKIKSFFAMTGGNQW